MLHNDAKGSDEVLDRVASMAGGTFNAAEIARNSPNNVAVTI
jgi:hypothetical protein